MSSQAFQDAVQLLGTRRFGTFWFASLLSNIGTWAQQVAQPWLLLSLGASPFLLGLDSFALAAPVFLLTLVGGALADATDRRTTIVKYQSLQMLCPVLLVVLLVVAKVQVWMVIGLSLVVGITDGLSMPSFQSIVPTIVDKKHIPTGIALNATQFNLSRIVGPALAGVLVTAVGLVGAFAVSAVSYLPFILIALWVLPRQTHGKARAPRMDWLQMQTNVRLILQQPTLRGALATVFASSLLCGPIVVFCPVLIKDVFHADVGHFSLAVGGFGVGGLVAAIALMAVDPTRDRRPISSGFAFLFGCVVVLTACNPWIGALPALLTLCGLCMTLCNTSANTMLQASALPSVRGQTVSLFMLAMRGGLALGALLTGLSAQWLGVRVALGLNGLLAVVVQLAIGYQWARSPNPAPER